jgi:hypothetical protein
MTINHRVIVERHPILNEVVGVSIPAVKSSLYLTVKNPGKYIGSQEPTHHKR